MGCGPHPYESEEEAALIKAGKQPVTMLPGGPYFDSSMSFGMVRGGKLDVTFRGAMQVPGTGGLANWMIPSKVVRRMGRSDGPAPTP